MKSYIWLRIAAVLMLIHAVGHTFGMLSGPSHGSEEIAVIEMMRNHQFDMMGTSRSYWDFFLGFGYDATINMLLQTALLWVLSRVAKTDPAMTRPFVAILTVVWIASTALYIRYLFIAPVSFAVLMVVVLAAAWITAKPRALAVSNGVVATGGQQD